MTYKEITDLIKLVNKSDLAELKLKDKDFEIQIRTKLFQNKSTVTSGSPVVQMASPAPVAPAAIPATPAPAAADNNAKQESPAESTAGLLEIKSPIVGTFYRSSSPDKPAFVKVGDTVEKGGVVCIVEAMKLFNEIESEVSGKIVKVMIEDAQPVEYDQVLFLVDPS